MKHLLAVLVSVVLSTSVMLGLVHTVPPIKQNISVTVVTPKATPVDFTQLRQATHELIGDRGACSGVMIEPHRMLSAAHCSAIGENMTVEGLPAFPRKIGDLHSDFMVLDVEQTCPCVPITNKPAQAGDHLYVVGYPYAAGVQFITEGDLQGFMKADGRFVPPVVDGYMMTTTHTWPGNSGGGVFIQVNGFWSIATVVSRGVAGLGVFPSTQMLQEFLSDKFKANPEFSIDQL